MVSSIYKSNQIISQILQFSNPQNPWLHLRHPLHPRPRHRGTRRTRRTRSRPHGLRPPRLGGASGEGDQRPGLAREDWDGGSLLVSRGLYTMYIYIYMYIFMYIYIYIYICMYAHTYSYMCMHISISFFCQGLSEVCPDVPYLDLHRLLVSLSLREIYVYIYIYTDR